MFEITRQAMTTEIRCMNCRASLAIDTDQRILAAREVKSFSKHHHCRLPAPEAAHLTQHRES